MEHQLLSEVRMSERAVVEPFKVFLIEDEQDLRQLVADLLIRAGYSVQEFAAEQFGVSGSGALQKLLSSIEGFQPDCVLLDQMMPGITGTELIRELRLRPEFALLPIIMLTGLGTEDDKVRALDLGADDYVTKPFFPKELNSRIQAVLRRAGRTSSRSSAGGLSEPKVQEESILKFNDLRVELKSHRATLGRDELKLTLTEFKILRELLKRVDQVLTREQLRSAALDSVNVTDRTIDVHMASLRKKLGAIGNSIETVRGVGYRLSERAG